MASLVENIPHMELRDGMVHIGKEGSEPIFALPISLFLKAYRRAGAIVTRFERDDATKVLKLRKKRRKH